MLQEIHDKVVQSTHSIANWNMAIDYDGVTVDISRKANSGDVATNIAMVVGSQINMDPKTLAAKIIIELEKYYGKDSCEIAGPGFINITLDPQLWYNNIFSIMFMGARFGDGDIDGDRTPINIEYVSANPTGPLHIGHARGAIFGDTLASLFEKSGFDTVREYYVNDAGGQMDALYESVRAYANNSEDEISANPPEYNGDYIKDIAQAWASLDKPIVEKMTGLTEEQSFRGYVYRAMMSMIIDDLQSLGIKHDIFTRESDILSKGSVDVMLQLLRKGDHTYKGVLPPPKGKEDEEYDSRKQLLFKATEFGDDVDRPLKKEDGSWTYFATDVAYHMDKYERGHRGGNSMINVWGADHGGYVKRLDSAITALTNEHGLMDVHLCQMVGLIDDGVKVKMSKRDNNFVTVKDVVDRVGSDALRFSMLTHKPDTQFDFDYQKATEETKDNMVYYIQYAHARGSSVIKKAADKPEYEDVNAEILALLTDDAEMGLIKKMALWPNIVNKATFTCEPHRVAYYLYELAGLFHSYWNMGNQDKSMRFLLEDNEDLSMARLILVQCVLNVIKSGLDVLGVSAPENM